MPIPVWIQRFCFVFFFPPHSPHLLGVGVRRHADAGGVALGFSAREPLVELLGDEGHQGRQEAQPDL